MQQLALPCPSRYRDGSDNNEIELETDQLAALGLASILSIGAENIYIDKDGLRYFCKVHNTAPYSLGVWNFEQHRPCNPGSDLPFMTAVGGHVLIHSADGCTILPDDWTGICVDARCTEAFWYIGQEGGERSYNRLQATAIDNAIAEVRDRAWPPANVKSSHLLP